MKMKTYLILCVIVAAVVASSVLFIPGVGDHMEQELLGFLSTNARG
jgi:hypothetical protein